MADELETRENALRRLPLPYSLALRLRDNGVASELICEYLNVEPPALAGIFRLVEAKLAAAAQHNEVQRSNARTLADRVFICDGCGVEIDRDLGAAINLARLGVPKQRGEQSPAGSGSAVGRGAMRETEPASARDAAGDEASTPPHHLVDQTGTASPQGEARGKPTFRPAR